MRRRRRRGEQRRGFILDSLKSRERCLSFERMEERLLLAGFDDENPFLEGEPNDSLEASNQLGQFDQITVKGTIAPSEDVDVFSFEAESGDVLSAVVTTDVGRVQVTITPFQWAWARVANHLNGIYASDEDENYQPMVCTESCTFYGSASATATAEYPFSQAGSATAEVEVEVIVEYGDSPLIGGVEANGGWKWLDNTQSRFTQDDSFKTRFARALAVTDNGAGVEFSYSRPYVGRLSVVNAGEDFASGCVLPCSVSLNTREHIPSGANFGPTFEGNLSGSGSTPEYSFGVQLDEVLPKLRMFDPSGNLVFGPAMGTPQIPVTESGEWKIEVALPEPAPDSPPWEYTLRISRYLGENTPPELTMQEPTPSATVVEGTTVTVAATANDTEEGDLTSSIVWSTDGRNLGSGGSVPLNSLDVGDHTITAEITDSGGLTDVGTTFITVLPDVKPDLEVTNVRFLEDEIEVEYIIRDRDIEKPADLVLFWADQSYLGPETSTTIAWVCDACSETTEGSHTHPSILGTDLNPPSPNTSYLIATINNSRSIDEGEEVYYSNEDYVSLSQGLREPEIQIAFNPDDPELGESYSIRVRVLNRSAIPLVYEVTLDEDFVSPRDPFNLDPRLGLDEAQREADAKLEGIVIKPGLSSEVLNGRLLRSWDWIDKDNPLDDFSNILSFITGGDVNSTLADIVRELKEGKSRFLKFIDKASSLSDLLTALTNSVPNDPRAQIRYDVTAKVDLGDLQRGTADGSIRDILYIDVPFWKRYKLTLAVTPGAWLAKKLLVSTIAAIHAGRAGEAAALALSLAGVVYRTYLAYEDAKDPPDPNFRELVRLTPLTHPLIETVPDGLLKSLAETSLRLEAVKQAETTSRNRADGAKLEGDALWESRQRAAAGRWAASGARLETQLAGMLQLFEPFRQAQLIPSEDELASVFSEGLPQVAIDLFNARGYSANDIEGALATIEPSILSSTEPMPVWLQISSVSSAITAIADLSEAARIRVEHLGETSRDISAVDQQRLANLRTVIDQGLDDGVPSETLLGSIESLTSEVWRILEHTNNPAALQDQMDFAYSALTAFSSFDVSPGGLLTLVTLLEADGEIEANFAAELRVKLASVEDSLTKGEFEASQSSLDALLQQIQDQRGQAISIEAAEKVAAYAEYLKSFVREPTDVNNTLPPEVGLSLIAVDESSPNGTYIGRITASGANDPIVFFALKSEGNTDFDQDGERAFRVDPTTGRILVNDVDDIREAPHPAFLLRGVARDAGGFTGENWIVVLIFPRFDAAAGLGMLPPQIAALVQRPADTAPLSFEGTIELGVELTEMVSESYTALDTYELPNHEQLRPRTRPWPAPEHPLLLGARDRFYSVLGEDPLRLDEERDALLSSSLHDQLIAEQVLPRLM